MNLKLYKKLNLIFSVIVFLLLLATSRIPELFNIIPQIILLFLSISYIINSKNRLIKIRNMSFKKTLILGYLGLILSIICLIGYFLHSSF